MKGIPVSRTLLIAALVAVPLPAMAADEAWVADARTVATTVPPKLLAALTEAIQRSGPEGAIAQCRDEAPRLARAASEQTGWAVRRVSLKPRNPKAIPDAWERATLEDFDRRAAAGEAPATLERAEVVQEGGQSVQRYMRALAVQPLCMNCHGQVERMTPAVMSQLKTLYPSDQGVGYAPGQIRGAMTLRKPLP